MGQRSHWSGYHSSAGGVSSTSQQREFQRPTSTKWMALVHNEAYLIVKSFKSLLKLSNLLKIVENPQGQTQQGHGVKIQFLIHPRVQRFNPRDLDTYTDLGPEVGPPV